MFPWAIVIPIFQTIMSAVSPMLKAAALTELKSLEVSAASQPFLEMVIKEAEVLVAAA